MRRLKGALSWLVGPTPVPRAVAGAFCVLSIVVGIFLWVNPVLAQGPGIQGVPVKTWEPQAPVSRIIYEKDMVLTRESLILRLWGKPSISPQDGKRYFVFIIPNTNSMWPTLGGNELILVEEIPVESLKVGDIIVWKSVFFTEGRTHRVVEIGKDNLGWWCKTKGDNNFGVDNYIIRGTDVLGIVRAIFYN